MPLIASSDKRGLLKINYTPDLHKGFELANCADYFKWYVLYILGHMISQARHSFRTTVSTLVVYHTFQAVIEWVIFSQF